MRELRLLICARLRGSEPSARCTMSSYLGLVAEALAAASFLSTNGSRYEVSFDSDFNANSRIAAQLDWFCLIRVWIS